MTNENNKIKYDESSIAVLEGLDAVRKRPGMYIGSTGTKGLHHLVYEIIDNSIDEASVGVCDKIYITIEEDSSVTVSDNGRGMPCGIHPKMKIPTLEVILTILHAGGKFGTGGYKTSGGLHGVGSSVVNALSEKLIATVHRDGNIYQQSYSRGKKLEDIKIIGQTNETGTTINFLPDKEIFKSIIFDYNTLAKRIKEVAFLNKNVSITFEDKRPNKEQINTYHYEGGIKEFIQDINKDKEIVNQEIIYIDKKIDTYNVEIGVQFNNTYAENLYSFANNINTIEGGYHVNGFYNAFVKCLNDYAKETGVLKNNSPNFTKEDIKEGISVVVSVKLEDPEFEGQTKTKLGNTGIQTIVSTSIKEYMEIYKHEYKSDLDLIVEKVFNTQQSRIASRKAKEDVRKNTGRKKKEYIEKLSDCSCKDPRLCEIVLTEGDSAGGNAKQSRNRKFQAILSQRGKSSNVVKKGEGALDSQDLNNIKVACNFEYGDKYKEEDLRYWKIICTADGDSDGACHIVPLWLTYFYTHCRKLIEDGHIYISIPPLYKNVVNKKELYTYSEDEQKEFLKSNKPSEIQRFKGLGEMSPQQLWDTTLNPDTRRLIQVTIDDFNEADETFELFMGKEVKPRREFIMENAKFAKELL
jgi:DNA gyrase subunit B